MKLKVLGINGGNGVILYPFRKSLIGNIEPRSVFHTTDNIQWKLNFKGISIDKDSEVYYRKSSVDVIVGAPDCGHSSKLAYSRGKALSDPKKNASLNIFFDKVNFYSPKLFLMENLPKLMENLGQDLGVIFGNYRLHIFVESVAAWGNSQITRERLVIVGVRKDQPKKIDRFIKLPNIDRSSLKKAGELIRGLDELDPSVCHVREPDDKMICLHLDSESRITVAKAREMWTTRYKLERKWPVNKERMKNQPGVYRNFANDYPMTVRKQNRQFNHRGYMLSPREMARIQNIPDSFKLWYDPTQHLFCINKGRTTVTKSPPYDIGLWFYDVLRKIENYVQ